MTQKLILIFLLLNLSACAPTLSGRMQVSSTTTQGTTYPGGTLTDFKLSCEEARFVSLINLYRLSQGKFALAVARSGTQSSRWHAQDMIDKNYFAHTEPNGRDFQSRAAAFGYSAWAENAAAGNADASATFCQWKNSAGHNSNMLGNHSTMGIGRALGGSYGAYWSNNFGPDAADKLAEPLTLEAGCVQPSTLPGC